MPDITYPTPDDFPILPCETCGQPLADADDLFEWHDPLAGQSKVICLACARTRQGCVLLIKNAPLE